MDKTLTLALLLMHALGGYYLPPGEKAGFPNAALRWFVYAAACAAVSAAYCCVHAFIAAGTLFILHVLIDSALLLAGRKLPARIWRDRLPLAGLAAHLAGIAAIGLVFSLRGIPISPAGFTLKFLAAAGLDADVAPRWTVLAAWLWRPSSAAIRHLLGAYLPDGKDRDGGKRAGALIGCLERLAIVLFMGMREYSAIGLVLTAKSIARYKRISEEQDFAEYYLLGTLMSTLAAVSAYLWIFN